MPQEKNAFLRVLVPALAIGVGVAIAAAVFRSSKPAASPATTSTPAPTPAPAPTPQQASEPASTPPQVNQQPTTGSATPASPTPSSSINWSSLRAQPWPSLPTTTSPALGDLDASQALQIEFSEKGAGVASLKLARHFTNIEDTNHVVLQEAVAPLPNDPASGIVPLSVLGLEVTLPQDPAAPNATPTKTFVRLFDDPAGPLWKPDPSQPGQFEALIVDAASQPVLRVIRTYSLKDTTGGITLSQRVENLSGTPLSVQLFQMGPIDLPQDAASYGGDKRRLRFGHLLDAARDPSRAAVLSDDYVIPHDSVLGKTETIRGSDGKAQLDASGREMKAYPSVKAAWPNALSTSEQHELVWMGLTNRYFSVAVYPASKPDAVGAAKTLQWVSAINRVYTLTPGTLKPVVGMRIDSQLYPLAPAGTAGSWADLSMHLYAGPLQKKFISSDALRSSMGLDGLVVYNFGGPCGFCTFGWMTYLLIGLLRVLHDFVFFDWALAIIFLVVIVRSVLHPVTRWSQIRIQRFGKQMSAVAPKQKELQEKYKDDPKKLQVETARLWREEGISPTGMLGCIPMFLQTPVWIALYATLYFAFELRHQGAFYGVFQQLQPASSPFWQFLGDLAEPDRFLYFGKTIITLPLLGPIESFNILPLILGVVFFIQQKYLTPPTTGQLSPEMEMQQTIMKWMMVVMFPVFMYNAPSGLAIYFIANSILGILESKWIKHHMDKHGLLDLDKMKAERLKNQRPGQGKGESFFERVQRMAEERQKMAQRMNKK